MSGIYDLKVGPPIEHTERFAVNIDPRESSLERIDPARLPEQLAPRTAPSEASSSITSSGATSTFAWFRPLMLVVIGLLVVESFLARWFGGGRG